MAKTRVQQAIEEGRVRLVRDEVVTVETTRTRILGANPNRCQALVSNQSGNPGYFAPSTGVSSTRGLYMAQNGGSASLVYSEDGEACFKEWFGILANASGSVHVLEWEVYDG